MPASRPREVDSHVQPYPLSGIPMFPGVCKNVYPIPGPFMPVYGGPLLQQQQLQCMVWQPAFYVSHLPAPAVPSARVAPQVEVAQGRAYQGQGPGWQREVTYVAAGPSEATAFGRQRSPCYQLVAPGMALPVSSQVPPQPPGSEPSHLPHKHQGGGKHMPLVTSGHGGIHSPSGGVHSKEPLCMKGKLGHHMTCKGMYSPTSRPMEAPKDVDGSISSWAWLVDGVLQTIVQNLPAASVQQVRMVCKHWKAVADQSMQYLCPTSLKSKAIISMFPMLQTLELTSCRNVRNRDLFVLCQSSLKLHTLIIGDDTNKPWVTNRGLSSIAKMTSLCNLSLHDCNSITNNGLSVLNNLMNLSILSLRGCKKITNNGLEVLQKNTALTSLNLQGCKRISDKGLQPLITLPLQSLLLGQTRIRDEGLSFIAQMQSLTELVLMNEEMTDMGVQQLSSLTNLQSLSLRDCCNMSGDVLLQLLPHMQLLQHLDLYKNWEFGDEQLLACLGYATGLRSLDLRGTWVTEQGIRELTLLTNLNRLSLAPHLDMYSDSLCVISSLTQLTSLSVNSCFYTTSFMGALRALTNLREVNLSDDVFSEEVGNKEPLASYVIDQLAEMSNLRSLDLSRRSIFEEDLVLLVRKLHNLQDLFLHGCQSVATNTILRLEKRHPGLTVHRKTLKAPEVAPPMAAVYASNGAWYG